MQSSQVSPSWRSHTVWEIAFRAALIILSALFFGPSTLPAMERDVLEFAGPGAVKLGGLLDARSAANISGRLLTISEDDLLDGYRHRPGKHPWIGEHVGKWLHASSLAWLNSKDAALRAKMDRVATALIATQEPDGYLGTYAPAERMGKFGANSWDVWSHKYCIIGLLAYHDATGSTEALACASRAGDYLVRTFAADSGKDINATSEHVGLASGSVVEPLVLLSRATSDTRYLELAERIVRAWDLPTGSHLLTNLLRDKTVLTVGNRKAYEMLSCLVGLGELSRSTGRVEYLQAAENAWKDVAANQLFPTGSGSVDERWAADRKLPYTDHDKVAETCVTVTWMQLNLQLYRLTGNPRYMAEFERSVYNHLLGAQKPDGTEFCYYTPLEGRKPYSKDLTCCFSSGTRGVAMIAGAAYSCSTSGDALQVNLYGPSTGEVKLKDGTVRVEQQTSYPLDGSIRLFIHPEKDGQSFAVQLRRALSASRWRVINGAWSTADGDWISIKRPWVDGDCIELQMDLRVSIMRGDHNTSGSGVVRYGELVFAADLAHNPGVNADALRGLRLPVKGDGALACDMLRSKDTLALKVPLGPSQSLHSLELVPFYEAGADGSGIETWFPLGE